MFVDYKLLHMKFGALAIWLKLEKLDNVLITG